jgi:hypothetical protein
MPHICNVHLTQHLGKRTIIFESVHILGHLQFKNARMHVSTAIVIKSRNRNHGVIMGIHLHLEGLRAERNMQEEFFV